MVFPMIRYACAVCNRSEQRNSAAGRGKVSGTRFLCKKPVPEPSGKNSKWLAVSQGRVYDCDVGVATGSSSR